MRPGSKAVMIKDRMIKQFGKFLAIAALMTSLDTTVSAAEPAAVVSSTAKAKAKAHARPPTPILSAPMT
jgi:hypothetical protein